MLFLGGNTLGFAHGFALCAFVEVGGEIIAPGIEATFSRGFRRTSSKDTLQALLSLGCYVSALSTIACDL